MKNENKTNIKNLDFLINIVKNNAHKYITYHNKINYNNNLPVN